MPCPVSLRCFFFGSLRETVSRGVHSVAAKKRTIFHYFSSLRSLRETLSEAIKPKRNAKIRMDN